MNNKTLLTTIFSALLFTLIAHAQKKEKTTELKYTLTKEDHNYKPISNIFKATSLIAEQSSNTFKKKGVAGLFYQINNSENERILLYKDGAQSGYSWFDSITIYLPNKEGVIQFQINRKHEIIITRPSLAHSIKETHIEKDPYDNSKPTTVSEKFIQKLPDIIKKVNVEAKAIIEKELKEELNPDTFPPLKKTNPLCDKLIKKANQVIKITKKSKHVVKRKYSGFTSYSIRHPQENPHIFIFMDRDNNGTFTKGDNLRLGGDFGLNQQKRKINALNITYRDSGDIGINVARYLHRRSSYYPHKVDDKSIIELAKELNIRAKKITNMKNLPIEKR